MSTDARTDNGTGKDVDWKFLALFLSYLLCFLMLGNLPMSSIELLRGFSVFTASAVCFLWSALAVPVTVSGTYVTFLGFPMEIILECTALHYMLVFAAGVFAYRGHALYYKIAGTVIGAAAIFFLNILRIGIIGFAGRYSPGMFAFIHAYLWQGMFALLVFLIWIVWANGLFRISKSVLRQGLFVLVVAFGSFWFMYAFLDYYASFLARAATLVFRVTSSLIETPVAAFGENRRIIYIFSGLTIDSDIVMYTMHSAIFFSLISLLTPLSQRRVFLMRVMTGSVVLLLLHLVVVVIDSNIMAKAVHLAVANRVRMDDLFVGQVYSSAMAPRWLSYGLSLAAPLFVAGFVKICYRSGDEQ